MNYLSIKKIGLFFAICLLAVIATVQTSCVKHKFDEPPIIVPYVNFPANMTIADLKKKFPLIGTDTAFMTDSLGLVKITGNIVIQGIVVANDESGNLYKQIFIQDSTGGIQVSIDQPSLYAVYRLGQRIFIKCKGLYLGQYGTATQLGYPFNGKIGRMPTTFPVDHLFNDSLPGPVPQPVFIDISKTNSNYFDHYQGMLVAFKNVSFSGGAGSQIAPGSVSSSFGIYDSTDAAIYLPKTGGKNLILYSSNYANFSREKLPYGSGTLVGIMTVYNSSYEMLIRDTKDFISFSDTLKTIYQNNFDANPSDWLIYTVSGAPWTFSSTYSCMVGNGYGGTAGSNTYMISPKFDLTGLVDPVMAFKLWTKYTDSGQTVPLEVIVSTDYPGTGNPTTATWTRITNFTMPAIGSAVMTGSGYINMSAYANKKIYVAFHYRSSGITSGTATTWEVQGFRLRVKN
jgi:hypothetical protein